MADCRDCAVGIQLRRQTCVWDINCCSVLVQHVLQTVRLAHRSDGRCRDGVNAAGLLSSVFLPDSGSRLGSTLSGHKRDGMRPDSEEYEEGRALTTIVHHIHKYHKRSNWYFPIFDHVKDAAVRQAEAQGSLSRTSLLPSDCYTAAILMKAQESWEDLFV